MNEEDAFDKYLDERLAELRVTRIELERRMGSQGLSESVRAILAVGDEREAFLLLAYVRDEFGPFWAEDLHRAWRMRTGPAPEASLQYKKDHNIIESVAKLVLAKGGTSPLKAELVDTRCILPTCRIRATHQVSVYSPKDDDGTVSLCQPHYDMVDGYVSGRRLLHPLDTSLFKPSR